MNKVYVYKTIGQEIKDIDTAGRTISGVFSKFGNVDSDGDIIAFGAFSKSIAERGPSSPSPRIKHFLNHDIYLPVSKLTHLEEREQEQDLYYNGIVGTHQLGNDVIQMALSGLITEHSIGFKPIDYSKREDESGRTIGYTFTGVKLWEGSSLTGWGANEFTPLEGLKSENIEAAIVKMKERQLKLDAFLRNTTASDELCELLTIEVKQLQQLSLDLVAQKSTPAADVARESLEKEKEDKALVLLKLLKLKI